MAQFCQYRPSKTECSCLTFFLIEQANKEPDHISLSARNGRFVPFQDSDLVEYLCLKETLCVHYLDKASSKWITHFRNSPAIPVNKDSVLHLKTIDTEVPSTVVRKLTDVKLEVTRAADENGSMPKRKALATVIDLTSSPDEPLAKRSRPFDRSSPSPTRIRSENIWEVGYVPARLNKFPPLTIADLDVRLQWMKDNECIGTTQERFDMVFNCRYTKSTYYNHRNLWKALKDNGALQALESTDEWLPVYSANANEEGLQRNTKQENTDRESITIARVKGKGRSTARPLSPEL